MTYGAVHSQVGVCEPPKSGGQGSACGEKIEDDCVENNLEESERISMEGDRICNGGYSDEVEK